MNVIQTLNDHGFQCYVVGGSVRDKLLGRTPHDFDLTTDATPEQVIPLFEKTIPTGIKHGTITIQMPDMDLEVTTFRQETTYSDHRHPDQITFVKDVKDDLARRDFTINAMAWSPQTGIVDPFGGQADLLKKTVRCVGNADKRFQEDALRMVRAHRFAAKLNFTIDEDTRQAIARSQHLIEKVAVERLYKEWMEILKYDPSQVADMTALFRPWIPELEECLHTPQNSPYHYTDVLHHILDSISYLKPFDETLALTLLLHDLGKPACKSTSPEGRDHFYRHPKAGRAIAQRVVEDLKLSNHQKKVIPELVLYHDDVMNPVPRSIYRFRIQKGWTDQMVQDLFKVQYCDIMAHSPKGRERLVRWQTAKDYYEEEKNRHPLSYSDLDITGDDIIRHTGLRKHSIKAALDATLERCFYHPELNERLSILTFILRSQKRFAQTAEKRKDRP